MTEWRIEATLFGGPLDGEKFDLPEPLTTLRVPLPPSPTLADFRAALSAEGPAVAVYVLSERRRLDLTPWQASMRGIPAHCTVAATYRFRP